MRRFDTILAPLAEGVTMKNALDIFVKQTKKPAVKKAPAKRAHRPRDLASLSPEVQEIVRLARRLQGSFGPT